MKPSGCGNAQPHPALQAAQSAADTQALEDVEPDRNRIILHYDCDCWYAQGRRSLIGEDQGSNNVGML